MENTEINLDRINSELQYLSIRANNKFKKMAELKAELRKVTDEAREIKKRESDLLKIKNSQ
jgi:hypothetical protein